MTLTVTPLAGIPEVSAGSDLARPTGLTGLADLLLTAVEAAGLVLSDGDVLVVSSKVVSKALGLAVPASPGDARTRDAVVGAHARRVVAERLTPRGTAQVVESAAGPVMAAAGVDASNAGPVPRLLLLPGDPDDCARSLRRSLLERRPAVTLLGVVLSDTAGRPWRVGQTDFALGAAGLVVLEDLRGSVDADGRPLDVTERAVADELAAAADLVKAKTRRVPAALLRGIPEVVLPEAPDAATARPPGAAALVRTGASDWFSLGTAESVRSALGVAPGTATAEAVGIASALPEPRAERLARAVAVALVGRLDIRAELSEAGVYLIGPDAFATGMATARLLVALAGERLAGVVRPPESGSATAFVELAEQVPQPSAREGAP